MLTAERHNVILKLLSQNNVVKLQAIVEKTNSSESTIRRDLAQLEEQGMLKRIHGGATLPYSKVDEPNMQEKLTKNLPEKKAVAEYAASTIRDGDCIFLDAGSTVSEMLPFLINKKIVVVTNGLMHLEALTTAKITTYLLGGRIKDTTSAIVGSVAQENLKKYRFDRCFLGMNGINLELGFTTPDPEEAAIKKLAIDLSEETFVLVDKSKFSETFFAKVADIHEATIVTNEIESELLGQYKEKTNLKVVKA